MRDYLPLRGQRLDFLAQFVLGIVATRTVNLTQIALTFCGTAKTASHYRRIQRFFKEFVIPQEMLVSFVLSLLPEGPFWLSMDRTNWKFGKRHINVLTVGIAYKGAAFPLVWMLLPKRKGGNSNTEERIVLMQRVIALLGKERIAGLLADREFIGKEWMSWLRTQGISFRIRIKENFKLPDGRHVRDLFRNLKPGEVRAPKRAYTICGVKVFLCATQLADEYMIVASDVFDPQAIETYKKRWEIETLFGCLKTRGLRCEDTHMTDPKKIATLFALLTIAFCFAHATGEWRVAIKPIPLKTHGRKTVSIFRLGLDWLRRIILDLSGHLQAFGRCLYLLGTRRAGRSSSA